MKNILHLIKFEYLHTRKNLETSKNIGAAVWGAVITILLSVLGVIFLVDNFHVKNQILSMQDCLSLVAFFVMFIIFLYCLTTQQKNVYLFKNKTLLHVMPISKQEIYLAKMIKNLFDTYVLSFGIIIPVVVTMGLLFKMSVGVVFAYLWLMLLSPLLPFSFAALLLLPLSYIIGLFKNKYVLKFCIAIIATIFACYVYFEIMFVVVEIVFLRGTSSYAVVNGLMTILNFDYFGNSIIANYIVSGQWNFLTMLYVVLSLLMLPLSLFVCSLNYKKVFLRDIVTSTIAAKKIKTKTVRRSAFKSYFIKECKDLFRSESYAFTYFGIATIMPMFVFFCGKFVLTFATQVIGSTIIFGTILLVIMMFCSVICTPASFFISKEGECFWILKSSPNAIKLSLYAKSLLGIVVSVCSAFVSLAVITIAGYIAPVKALILFLIAVLYIVGLICMGLIINIKRPNLFLKNKENTSNTYLQASVSIVISFLIGFISILLSFDLTFYQIVLVVGLIVGCFTAVNAIFFFMFGKKLFSKVEV